ncbi:unnamed protein product [Ostreobium quekettii]|uniref:Uncharacterized protein n=1 Tax=Ostreobium quekettii TaxID=121088 RepID=A0A8S1J786_9CHLO|nr:unnamed protein product [Ostreobium quekettii]
MSFEVNPTGPSCTKEQDHIYAPPWSLCTPPAHCGHAQGHPCHSHSDQASKSEAQRQPPGNTACTATTPKDTPATLTTTRRRNRRCSVGHLVTTHRIGALHFPNASSDAVLGDRATWSM